MAHSMHWIAAGALLLAAGGFAALGRWQLDRAAVNRGVVDSFVAAESHAPIERPVEDAAPFRYRPIRLRGRYLPESQILLDNLTHRGVAGYQVLTPFQADGGGLVLVNRGWLPAAADRSRLPDVALDNAGDVVVTGRIDQLPRAGLDLTAPVRARGGAVTVLSFPDYADIETTLGSPVHRFQLLLDPAAPDGFLRDWAPSGERAGRNTAYAVQWFGLALLALVLAIGVALRGRRRAPGAAR